MGFRFAPMTLADAQVVADWHYEGLYAVSNWEDDSNMLGDFLRWPALYCSVSDENNNLVGFAQFARLQRDTDTLSTVWGLRPDLIGKGNGLAFVESCLAYARARYEPKKFALGVWAFNQRGRHVYEQLGFTVVRVFNSETRFGVLEFVEMVREGTSLKTPKRINEKTPVVPENCQPVTSMSQEEQAESSEDLTTGHGSTGPLRNGPIRDVP